MDSLEPLDTSLRSVNQKKKILSNYAYIDKYYCFDFF